MQTSPRQSLRRITHPRGSRLSRPQRRQRVVRGQPPHHVPPRSRQLSNPNSNFAEKGGQIGLLFQRAGNLLYFVFLWKTLWIVERGKFTKQMDDCCDMWHEYFVSVASPIFSGVCS